MTITTNQLQDEFFAEGFRHASNGGAASDCPHGEGTDARAGWMRGYRCGSEPPEKVCVWRDRETGARYYNVRSGGGELFYTRIGDPAEAAMQMPVSAWREMCASGQALEIFLRT